MNYSSPLPLPRRSPPPSTHSHCSRRLLFHSLSPPMAAAIASSIVLLPQKPYSFTRKPNPRKSTNGISRRTPPAITASSSFRNGSQPETESPVPFEQQPVNEYQSLSTSFLFSWAIADLRDYCSRLALTGASFAILVGLPVAAFGTGAASSAPAADALRCGLGATSAGLLAVTLAVLRMYLGWAYVGNRLLSATVDYEETGWYDGQIWVKTPEVLARDRLLGSFSVKPVLTRVKFTLVGLAVSLAVCVILFINVENPRNASDNASEKVIAGVYDDAAARSFEPDAFCREPDLS